MNYDLMNGADLAYIGDACYELYIREYILKRGLTKLYELHKASVKYVSRTAQAKIIKILMEQLSEKELEIFKRGRNYKYKQNDIEYLYASGFEALIGYLYLKKDNERLEYIISKSIEIVENE